MDPVLNEHADQVQAIHWRTPTHIHTARSVDWFWALGIIAICGAIIAAWLGDALFGVIIVVAAAVIGMISAREPREHDVTLQETGVVVDHELYPFHAIRSFWIEHEGMPLPKMYLSTNALIHPHVIVLLPSEDYADEVRDFLEMYDVKEEAQHSAGTMLARMFGW